MIQSALTTVDNPYDPFTEFDKWFLYDVEKGYNSCAYLARISGQSNKLTDEQNFSMDEEAIDTIVSLDPFNIYTKVQREVDESEIHI